MIVNLDCHLILSKAMLLAEGVSRRSYVTNFIEPANIYLLARKIYYIFSFRVYQQSVQ
nr:MAG TPA: hypothetical protein [Caudoviricetes sp.]